MKKIIAALLIVVMLASVAVISFADDGISKLTGVWICEEDKYIDIIAINGNNAIYLYFTKDSGSVSSVSSFYVLLDPDNANRVLAVQTDSEKPAVQIWSLLEDGTLKKTDTEIFTKK